MVHGPFIDRRDFLATSAGAAAVSALPAWSRIAHASCHGAIVGNPAEDPVVAIVGLECGARTVRGYGNNIDTQEVAVVLWALTNQWYVQPVADPPPFTPICSDGSWQNGTNPWIRMVALLVDRRTYVPAATRLYHPSFDPGVLAWAQVPPPRPDTPLDFSGYRWGIKVAECRFDPGPNYFSDSPENVWVDADGLHLNTRFQTSPEGSCFQNFPGCFPAGGRWTSSEVHLLQSLGYGAYTVQLASRVDDLDPVAVFAPFIYESLNPPREFDIEFSRALETIPPDHNAQYVVQPWSAPDHVETFPMPSVSRSTHRMAWSAGQIHFVSWRGWAPYHPHPDDVIHEWVYTGPDIPAPGGERMRFNLWQFGGRPPVSGVGDEVIVRSFVYQPFVGELMLRLNQTTFRPGDTLRVELTVRNPGPTVTGDCYFGLLLPDGVSVFFVTSLSPLDGVMTRLDADPRTFRPLHANVQLPQGLDITLTDFLVYPFAGEEPPGTSSVVAALTPPGAFNDGRVDPGDLWVIDAQPFSFSP